MSERGSFAREIDGPWLVAPPLRRTFDLNRDPHIRMQLLDMERTEAERRGDSGEGSGMVKQDRPEPVPPPPKETAQAVDRDAFERGWLREQRDAAMRAAVRQQTGQGPERGRTRDLREPSR